MPNRGKDNIIPVPLKGSDQAINISRENEEEEWTQYRIDKLHVGITLTGFMVG